MSMRTSRATLILIVSLAMLARLAVVVPRLGRPLDDPDHYLPLARCLASGQGYILPENGTSTAYRPPLYPVLLAPFAFALGEHLELAIPFLHMVLGVGTILLTYGTALRWRFPPPGALVAAAIVGLDPVLVGQARPVMTETLAAFLVALTLFLLSHPNRRWAAFGGGLGFGLAGLCRPSLLPAAELTVVGAILFLPGSVRQRAGFALRLMAVTVVVLSPWAMRNWIVFGEPLWTTTHGGYTLALANNSCYYADVLNGPPGAVWSGPHQAEWFRHVGEVNMGRTEQAADRVLWSEGLALMAERPRDFARAAVARLGRLWAIAPAGAVYSPVVRLLTALWSAPLFLALIVGLTRRETWRWPRLVAPIFLFSLTTVHALFWADLRMRAPIVPAIALIAASVLTSVRSSSMDLK